jgi:hypothetical protein
MLRNSLLASSGQKSKQYERKRLVMRGNEKTKFGCEKTSDKYQIYGADSF